MRDSVKGWQCERGSVQMSWLGTFFLVAMAGPAAFSALGDSMSSVIAKEPAPGGSDMPVGSQFQAGAAGTMRGPGITLDDGTFIPATSLDEFAHPAPGSPIASHFDPHRLHPIHNVVRPHNGTDFGTPRGTPIGAAAHGLVSIVGWDENGYGNYVVVQHPQRDGTTVHTLYGHLDTVSVRRHQTLAPGDTIGGAGSTGLSTGPHLHYEIRTGSSDFWQATPIDAASYLHGQEGHGDHVHGATTHSPAAWGNDASETLTRGLGQAFAKVFSNPALHAALGKDTAAGFRASSFSQQPSFARPQSHQTSIKQSTNSFAAQTPKTTRSTTSITSATRPKFDAFASKLSKSSTSTTTRSGTSSTSRFH